MLHRPDRNLCLAALLPEDRATIARWAEILGLEWFEVRPLLQLVETLAVVLRSADLDLPAGDAVRASAELLGLQDDAALASHPADRYGRNLANWHKRASARKIF